MKIAILGGGFTGLTAGYELAGKNHQVTLFEQQSHLGGLAQGFKGEGWSWCLERAYHHLFASDSDILNFARESGFEKIIFRSPETASFYRTDKDENNYGIFPLDSPQDFLRFPLLSWPAKIRSAAVLAFLKFSPFLSPYEKSTAEDFLRQSMGEESWKVLWQELFRKKFGKYAENIVASFIWARINKRTKKLGYVEGGFQTLVDYLEKKNVERKVSVKKNCRVNTIIKKRTGYEIGYRQGKSWGTEYFEAVISTLPSPIIPVVGERLFPQEYLKRLKKLRYLFAVVIILENNSGFLPQTYWLNICDPTMPLMFVGQHTNFIDKKYYAGHHLHYVGWYVDEESKLLKMNTNEIKKFIAPSFRKINPNFPLFESKSYIFKAAFAQPIFDRDFVANRPDFMTPLPNFYIANLDMTYPYDRGTNYAVKLGKRVAKLIK
ncbi:FAD-dependent oxidoreductase [Candidatus Roizmanbacteria bacterium]|nr:FAD-dependent oxidoreductase [Candidatus Roizmanbacteria bacterium]